MHSQTVIQRAGNLGINAWRCWQHLSASSCENTQVCSGQTRPASKLEHKTWAREDWQAPHFLRSGPKLKEIVLHPLGPPKYPVPPCLSPDIPTLSLSDYVSKLQRDSGSRGAAASVLLNLSIPSNKQHAQFLVCVLSGTDTIMMTCLKPPNVSRFPPDRGCVDPSSWAETKPVSEIKWFHCEKKKSLGSQSIGYPFWLFAYMKTFFNKKEDF